MANFLSPFTNIGFLYSKIYTFYENLSDFFRQRLELVDDDIKESLQYHNSHYSSEGGVRDPNYDVVKHCVAYTYKYASCHSAMVCEVMAEQLKTVQHNTSTALDTMKLVFLGGGSGNDAVGFLTSLSGIPPNLKKLDISVVDKHEGWREIFEETVTRLKAGEIPGVERVFQEIEVNISFIKANLASSKEKLKKVIRNANIIFMVKVLSCIPMWDIENVLKNIVTSSKSGSIIIIIDWPIPVEMEYFMFTCQLRLLYSHQRKTHKYPKKNSNQSIPTMNMCQAAVNIYRKQ